MKVISPDSAINFVHLRQYVGDDRALTAEIFGLFKMQTEMWSRALTPSADDETWTTVTHTLKGSARAVGAEGLADACEGAERLIGPAATLTARTVAVHDMQDWIAAVLHRIQRWEFRQKLAEVGTA